MSAKKKMFQAAAGNAGGGPADDDFNTVSFLSHFDGDNNGVNSVFEDSSTSNHTITATGDVTQGSFSPFFRESVSLYNVTYDASAEGNYIDFGSSTHTFWDSDFTLEFWIKTTATDLQCLFSSWYDTGFGESSYAFSVGASGIMSFSNRLSSGTNQAATMQTSATVNDGTWHHVAYTQVDDGGFTKYFRIFIDGVLQAYATENAWTQGATLNGAYIGSQGPNTFNGASRRFVGSLTNFRLSHNLVYSTSSTTIGETIFSPPQAALTAPTSGFLTLNSASIVDNGPSSYTINSSSAASVSESAVFTKDPEDAYNPSVHGASAYFEGTPRDYLSAPNSSDWALGDGDFTIEAWVYVAPQSIKQAIIGHWTNSSRGWQARVENSGGGYKLRWTWTTNGGTDYSKTGTIVASFNTWNHVAWVRSGSTLTLYVNGVAGGTVAGANIYAPNTPLVLGDWDSNQSDFRGYMSDVRLVKGTAVYTSDFTPPTAPLTAVTNTKLLLSMDNAQVFDSTAQNNLELYGNAKISNAQSKFGGTSFALDGTGDYAEFIDTDVGNFGTSDFTIECWFRSDQFDSLRTLISKYTTVDGYRSWRLFFDTANKLKLDITQYGTGSGIQALTTASSFSANTWYHLAVVRNGATITIYINGTADSNTLNYGASTPVFASTTKLLIGAQSNSSGTRYYFDGYIDELRISRTARYTEDFTPPTEPFADKGP